MNEQKRCESPICVVKDGIRGRMFTPQKEGIGTIWCATCVYTNMQINFFTQATIQMIRGKYKTYMTTALPKQTKLFLKQFTAELVKELGGEL